MGKTIFLLSFLVFYSYTLAQVSHTQGDWVKRKNTASHQGFLFSDSSKVFSIDFHNNRFSGKQALYTNVFDKKSGIFLESVLLATMDGKDQKSQLKEVFSLRESFYTVSTMNPKTESASVTIHKVDILGNVSQSLQIDLQSHGYTNDSEFKIITDNAETVFIVAQNIPQTESKKQRLIIECYDDNLFLKWRRTVEFPDKSKQFVLSDFNFDGENKITFTGQNIVDLYQPDLQISNLKQNTYFLFQYNYDKDQLQEIELDLNQRFIIELKIKTSDSSIIVCGIYSKTKSFEPQGIFNLLLDEKFRLKSNNLHDFTEDDLKMLVNSQKRKSKKNKFELQLHSVLLFDDGEFMLLTEEFQKEWDVANNREIDGNNYTETFIYGNILHFKFDQYGQWEKSGVITKRQTSVNDDGVYSSISAAKSNTKNIVILFNDNPKNIENGNSGSPVATAGQKTFLRSVQITQSGVQTTKVITSSSRFKRITPTKSSQLLDGKTYLLSEKRRKMSLIIVE